MPRCDWLQHCNFLAGIEILPIVLQTACKPCGFAAGRPAIVCRPGIVGCNRRKLQRVPGPYFKPRHASATALLKTLHWLSVKARIQYKIACLCFQCISQNSMPPYISDLLHPYCPSRTLRSLDTTLLTVPRFSLETFSKRSFSVFGPTVWNSLPLSLRKTQCFTTFKTKLKTHLFGTHLC